jgi:hypothetical protein
MNSASAISVDSVGNVVLCKAVDGSPFFLVRVGSSISRSAFRLRYVTFQFNVVYKINVVGHEITDTCSKIECNDKSVLRQRLFVESISSVVSECSGIEPLALIDALVELFSRSQTVSPKSLIGVWGELLFILSCSDCDNAVMAWHSEPNQIRDFVFLENAVEVKTTSSGERKHFFSLSQITSAQDGDLLCSIMVEETDSGRSIMELAMLIDEKCGSEGRAVFWSKFILIADELPSDYEDTRFEMARALTSMRFFELLGLNHPVMTSSGKGRIHDVTFSLTL